MAVHKVTAGGKSLLAAFVDGEHAIVVVGDSLSKYRVADGAQLENITDQGTPCCAAISPDRKRIATCTSPKEIVVDRKWYTHEVVLEIRDADLHSVARLQLVPAGFRTPREAWGLTPRALAFSADGSQLLAQFKEAIVTYSATDLAVVSQFKYETDGTHSHIQPLPDGRIACATGQGVDILSGGTGTSPVALPLDDSPLPGSSGRIATSLLPRVWLKRLTPLQVSEAMIDTELIVLETHRHAKGLPPY